MIGSVCTVCGSAYRAGWICDCVPKQAQPAAQAAAVQVPREPTQAASDVLAERERQVSKKGWTPKHDNEHDGREMAQAAGCYALHAAGRYTDVRPGAIALILAEIERLDRATAQPAAQDQSGGVEPLSRASDPQSQNDEAVGARSTSPDHADLLRRLELVNHWAGCPGRLPDTTDQCMCPRSDALKAAAAIRALQAENARLREKERHHD